MTVLHSKCESSGTALFYIGKRQSETCGQELEPERPDRRPQSDYGYFVVDRFQCIISFFRHGLKFKVASTHLRDLKESLDILFRQNEHIEGLC